jgi:hypothetical protein
MQQSFSSDRQSKTMAGAFADRIPRSRGILAGIAILAVIGLVVAAVIWKPFRSEAAHKTIRLDISAPPPPLPALKQGFLPIEAARAEVVNAGIALSTAPIEPSRPFTLPAMTGANLASHQSAIDCLTAAVYYEAASETATGQRAVAQVVLNRMRHPAYPKSVCGVVYEGAERRTGCQFSFTCDGSLARTPSRSGWDRARGIATAALAGYVERSVGTATHYHTTWVVPYWAWSLDKITVVGAHIFYRWKGYWGRAAAFKGVYAGETVSDEQSPLFQLFSEYDLPLAEASSAPLGPRPLADDIGRLGDGPSPNELDVAPLRADQQSGTLSADEKAGTLIHAAPKTAAQAN